MSAACAYLGRLPAYLQQLELESNGKHVDLAGRRVTCQTAPVIWGQPGTNGQHAFYQALHQGTKLVLAELIGFWQPVEPLGRHHDLLMANMFAPAEALAFGRHEDSLAEAGSPAEQIPHRVCEGNHPTTAILLDGLTPENSASRSLSSSTGLHRGRHLGDRLLRPVGVELGKILATTSSRSWKPERHPTSPTTAPPLP